MKTLVYCGVHHGYSLDKIAAKFDRVIAIEANPEMLAIAKDRLRKHGHIEFIEGAIVPSPDLARVRFNVYGPGAGSSSIVEMNQSIVHQLVDDVSLQRVIEAPAIFLPVLFVERRVEVCTKLVLDLQGIDVAVIESLRDWFADGRIHAVQFEADSCGFQCYLSDNTLDRARRFFSTMPLYEYKGKTFGDPNQEVAHGDYLFQRKGI